MSEGSSRARWTVWVAFAALVGATLAAYEPALRAGFVWDDDYYVTANPLLTAPDGLRRIWFATDAPSQYFPLTYSAFRIQYALWGADPAGYHWTNVLLHAANAGLVAWAMRRIGLPGGWLAAALFALHPVHVESVAWITELKNTLSLHLMLWALHAWIAFSDPTRRRRGLWYGLSLGAHALALFAKTTACTFPAAQILVPWLMGRRLDRRLWLSTVPFVALGLAMGSLSIWWEIHRQGTEWSASFFDRVSIASRALVFYLEKLVWPHPLIFSYPKFELDASQPSYYASGLVLVVAAAALFVSRHRPAGRGLAAAGLWFVAMLSPLIGFIDLYTFEYSFVADHYQYVASLGPLCAFAVGGAFVWRRGGTPQRALLALGLAGILGTLAVLTHQQARVYRDDVTLWRDVVAKAPDSWIGHTNLGRALLRGRQPAEALEAYRNALEDSPHPEVVHSGIARALALLGRDAEAIESVRRAIAAAPERAAGHFQLGRIELGRGSFDAARRALLRAHELRPGWSAPVVLLAGIHAAAGRPDAAAARIDEYLRSGPAAGIAPELRHDLEMRRDAYRRAAAPPATERAR